MAVNLIPWLWLTIAIFFEVSGTVSLKYSYGMTKWLPSVLAFTFYAGCFTTLSFALKKIEVSIAYAIWAGLGTALIAAIGLFYFGESFTLLKAISMVLILAGVIGLNLL